MNLFKCHSQTWKVNVVGKTASLRDLWGLIMETEVSRGTKKLCDTFRLWNFHKELKAAVISEGLG